MDDSPEENYVEFRLKFLVIKILHCWFNFLVLQEMLLPWHELWGCEHDMQCPSELLLCHKHSQCLELALRWVLPPPQASCWFFPGSQNLPGGFPSPLQPKALGLHLTSSNWWWCLTQTGCNPNSLFYGRAWPPCCRSRRWEKCFPQGLNCARGGTQWKQG